MKNIEVAILSSNQSFQEAEDMMVAMARMTQKGHTIKCMQDLLDLIARPHSDTTVENMCALPHPTIQKFGLINIAVVGASRRFLAQITRHQNEIKFMSGSLQYSDYSDDAQFCVPYEITKWDHDVGVDTGYGIAHDYALTQYLNSCKQSMDDYRKASEFIGHDAAGYMAPQGMRNVLVMSVLPFELKHIISQRCCNRNTLETQYVMLKVWELLWAWPMFRDCGPFCTYGPCMEGRMCCGNPMTADMTPTDILKRQFPLLYKEDDNG